MVWKNVSFARSRNLRNVVPKLLSFLKTLSCKKLQYTAAILKNLKEVVVFFSHTAVVHVIPIILMTERKQVADLGKGPGTTAPFILGKKGRKNKRSQQDNQNKIPLSTPLRSTARQPRSQVLYPGL